MASAFLSALRALPDLAEHGPCVDVSWRDLRASVSIPARNDGGVQSVVSAAVSALRPVARTELPILNGLSGRIPHGTSCLVLANAGGGKTTLLRLLAGRESTRQAGFSGSVSWNGEAPGAGAAKACKIAAFAPQVDVHEPLLTVRETLEFAAASCLADLPAEASAAAVALRARLVDHVLDALELRECEGVILGDELKRGVSGGQKKRVTLGEALMQGARVLVLDEITSGLDAATAASIVRFLTQWAHLTGGTVITALQAPTPEILAAFDSVLLLSDGYTLFHGAPHKLEPYLASLGYVRPAHVDIADYALALCVLPSFVAGLYHAAAPPALQERSTLAQAWSESPSNKAAEMAAASGASKGIILAPSHVAQFGKPTVHPALRHTRLLVSRQARVVFRNPAISFGRIFQFILLASIFGSIYYKLSLDNFIVKISLCIFAASAVSFASFAEIPVRVCLGGRGWCAREAG